MSKCLIVDDSPTVRRIARRIFEELGFSCKEAENGLIAYESCADEMPDVIMLDWNMPVMSGYEFLLKLRSLPDGSNPKVFFCTTETGFDFIQKGMAAGADEYIMKPFDRTILASKLSQMDML